MNSLIESICNKALSLIYELVEQYGVDYVLAQSVEPTEFVGTGDVFLEDIRTGVSKEAVSLDLRLCLHVLSSIGEKVPAVRDFMSEYKELVYNIYAGSAHVVKRLCSSYKLDPESFDDFGQDLYLKLVFKLPLYDAKKASFDTWLSYLVSNQLASLYRKRKRLMDTNSDDDVDIIVGDEGVMRFSRDDVDRFYQSARSSLDENERIMVEAIFGVGGAELMTYKELASLLGGSADNLRLTKKKSILEKLHDFAIKDLVF